MKIYLRLRTWIMIAILIVMTVAIASITRYYAPADLMPSLWMSVNDLVNGLYGLVIIFTIIVAAEIVAGEFSWGTIKLLLIRPARRAKILLSKYIAVLLFSIVLNIVSFVTAYLISGILFGFSPGEPMPMEFPSGIVQDRNTFGYVLGTIGYNFIDLIMIMTFAFMISTVFRSSSMAIGFSLFFMFMGTSIVYGLSRYEWVKYILFANMDLRRYIEGTPLVEGMTMGFSVTMLAIYFVVMNLLSWLIFAKRDIAA
jgi:ABC-2 type transport system permease protein